MSYTYTPRPSQIRSNMGRGRGRSQDPNLHLQTRPAHGPRVGVPNQARGFPAQPNFRPRMANPGSGQDYSPHPRGGATGTQQSISTAEASPSPESIPKSQEEHDRVVFRDAYCMIKPDEKKRNAIQQKARQEEQRYQEHKDRQRVSHVSYVGTVGGGEITEEKARALQQSKHRNSNITRKILDDERKAMEKEKEEKELEAKKAVQRRKAEQLVERNKLAAEHRKQQHHEDHKRKNEEFLNRLEKQNKVATEKNIPATATSSRDSIDHDDRYEVEDYDDNALAGASGHAVGCRGLNNSQSFPVGDTRSSYDHRQQSGHSTNSLSQLINLYPRYQPEVLCQIWESCNGDLDAAISLLDG